MLLDVILETHAWAAARPKHESHAAVQKFEKKISEVMEVEKEQGMSPPRTVSFSPSSLLFLFVGRPHFAAFFCLYLYLVLSCKPRPY